MAVGAEKKHRWVHEVLRQSSFILHIYTYCTFHAYNALYNIIPIFYFILSCISECCSCISYFSLTCALLQKSAANRLSSCICVYIALCVFNDLHHLLSVRCANVKNLSLPDAFNTSSISKDSLPQVHRSMNKYDMNKYRWYTCISHEAFFFFKCHNYQWNVYTGQTFMQLPLKST